MLAMRKPKGLNSYVDLTLQIDYNSPSQSSNCFVMMITCTWKFPTLYKFFLQAELLEDFLLPMLDFVPSKRATAQDVLKHPWLSTKET